jgi:hypothetical protein
MKQGFIAALYLLLGLLLAGCATALLTGTTDNTGKTSSDRHRPAN